MNAALAIWQQHLSAQTDRDPATVAEYVGDVRRFIAWVITDLPACRPADVTVLDAKAYRQFLLDAGRAPATINRALISLTLFFDATGRNSNNPFRRLERVAQVEAAPKALTRYEWNAVRRTAEQAAARDHGLALALVSLMRYAGPRVAEVAALQLGDVLISPRRGLLTIRRGKGLKHREVPLIQDARDAFGPYLEHRRNLADHWRTKALLRKQPSPTWRNGRMGIFFLGSVGRSASAAFVTSWLVLAWQPNSTFPCIPTRCDTPLQPPCSTRLPMASTVRPPRYLPCRPCSATVTSMPRRFIHAHHKQTSRE